MHQNKKKCQEEMKGKKNRESDGNIGGNEIGKKKFLLSSKQLVDVSISSTASLEQYYVLKHVFSYTTVAIIMF